MIPQKEWIDKRKNRTLMKYILFTLLIAASISCSQRTTKCEISMTDNAVYRGYGVIVYSYSTTGTVRYMEFYPLCAKNIKNIEIEDITYSNFGEGVIFRETVFSDLWQTLIADDRINMDQEEYGKALIYIEFNSKINKENEVKFKNYFALGDKGFNLTIRDIGLSNIDAEKIEVIKGLE